MLDSSLASIGAGPTRTLDRHEFHELEFASLVRRS